MLEALRWIQVRRDRTLALRHSCLHASCGTCGVRVNGREGLACVTMVHDLGREVTALIGIKLSTRVHLVCCIVAKATRTPARPLETVQVIDASLAGVDVP